MALVPRPSITSIETARPELERLLEMAHESFTRGVNGDADARALCAKQLRQADGVLRMLELHDAAQLARDLAVASADERGGVAEAMRAALTVLARYPAYVCERRAMRPELLRSEHDVLRARRGLEALPEHCFLSDPAELECCCPPGVPAADAAPELPRRLRHLYQLGLLAVVRGRFDPVHVRMMRRACDRMLALTGGGAAGERWWLLGGVLEGFANGALHATPARIRALSAGDGWLRTRVRDAASGDEALDTAQRHALLTLVMRGGTGERITEIRRHTGVELVLPDDDALARERRRLLGGTDNDAAMTVAAAQAEFGAVRRTLDALTPGAAAGPDQLGEVAAALRRVAQTFVAEGLAEGAARLEASAADLDDDLRSRGEANTPTLQRLADVVVEAEVALDGFARTHGLEHVLQGGVAIGDTLTQARNLTLMLARECIESAKRELAAAVDAGGTGPWSTGARTQIDAVRGALHVLGHGRAGAVAARVLALLDAVGNEAVGGDLGEGLADVLIALEYCIASLQVGEEPDRRVLEVARIVA